MKPNNTYIWSNWFNIPIREVAYNIEEQAMRVAWDAECARVQAPARISYADLAFLSDLAQFVRLFEDCLSFDDAGLIMQRRG